jgi:uridine kinase
MSLINMSKREAVLADIANTIEGISDRAMIRVAIDGVDGAGKTCFADELAGLFSIPVIRASPDSFHNPRTTRYAQGKQSPKGFYEDSFNYPKLKQLLLDPLSREPAEAYCCRYFDHQTDAEVAPDWKDPPQRAVLVFDGIFAHRPELVGYWDYSIFLDVSPEVSVKRCIEREGVTDASYDPNDPIHSRYVQGQAIYIAACDPRSKCTIRILNEVIELPKVVA